MRKLLRAIVARYVLPDYVSPEAHQRLATNYAILGAKLQCAREAIRGAFNAGAVASPCNEPNCDLAQCAGLRPAVDYLKRQQWD